MPCASAAARVPGKTTPLLTDGFITRTLHPSQAIILGVKVAAVAPVLVLSQVLAKPKET